MMGFFWSYLLVETQPARQTGMHFQCINFSVLKTF